MFAVPPKDEIRTTYGNSWVRFRVRTESLIAFTAIQRVRGHWGGGYCAWMNWTLQSRGHFARINA